MTVTPKLSMFQDHRAMNHFPANWTKKCCHSTVNSARLHWTQRLQPKFTTKRSRTTKRLMLGYWNGRRVPVSPSRRGKRFDTFQLFNYFWDPARHLLWQFQISFSWQKDRRDQMPSTVNCVICHWPRYSTPTNIIPERDIACNWIVLNTCR